MTGRRLLDCRAGGTGYLEYVIVFALVAVVVAVGAHVYGQHTRDGFERHAATVGAVDEPVAAADSGADASPVALVPDWRRLIDLLVALPFVWMAILAVRSWRQRRARRRQLADERRRAARLRAVVGDGSVLVDGDVVADQKVAQVVTVHRGRTRGARDVAAVAAD